jgi:peptidoglycan hydrolase-like protein with peptidoglycan-binding domain
MLKGRVAGLAIAGTLIVTAGLFSLSTTAASAATTTAASPADVTAPAAAAAATCVDQVFSIADEGTYYTCVNYEQVLLNDLQRVPGPGRFTNQTLTTDGYYGPLTTGDVKYFQTQNDIAIDGVTGPQTWYYLCWDDFDYGWTGTYWQAAGCPALI